MHRKKDADQEGHSKCPFLAEVDAFTCNLATVKKFVPDCAIVNADQRCSSADWRSCPLGPSSTLESAEGGGCPFLRRLQVQRCTAAPIERLIPRTDLPSRCNGPSHRYCELYLERTDPHSCRHKSRMALPPGLALAPNHMWLDVESDGTCHLGVDAFLARVVGAVDRVIFPSARRPTRPSVVLTMAVGLELPLVFPQVIEIASANVELRRHPDALATDPYRRGWLYEGKVRGDDLGEGLRRGAQASAWLETEAERLTTLVHDMIARRGCDLGPTLADGGVSDEGLAQQLSHGELLQVFVAFFAG